MAHEISTPVKTSKLPAIMESANNTSTVGTLCVESWWGIKPGRDWCISPLVKGWLI